MLSLQVALPRPVMCTAPTSAASAPRAMALTVKSVAPSTARPPTTSTVATVPCTGPTLTDARIDSSGYLQQMKSLRG